MNKMNRLNTQSSTELLSARATDAPKIVPAAPQATAVPSRADAVPWRRCRAVAATELGSMTSSEVPSAVCGATRIAR